MNTTQKATTTLIVEDEPTIREGISILLDREGFKTIAAALATEDLDILSSTPDIFCIVSDIRMPIMNGVEFIKAVRKNNLNIPFIFLLPMVIMIKKRKLLNMVLLTSS